jgi:hypothetical protein
VAAPGTGPAERRGGAALDISPGRAALVNALIAFILAGYGVSILWEVEAFPFSHFPMYSGSRAGVSEFHELVYVGVVGADELELSKRQLEQLAGTRKKYLDRYLLRMKRRRGRALDALAKLTALSDARGAALARPIPRLDGMRVYRHSHALDPRARNRDEPDRRELLLEFLGPGAGTGAG